MEIHRPGTKGVGHLGAAQIALPRVAAARGLLALQSLHRGLESILAPAGDELLDQRSKPGRRVSEEFSMRPSRWAVKD
jgi:hypothetical protein